MNLPSISEITNKAQGAFKRFPIPLIWAIAGTLFCMTLLEGPGDDRLNENSDILITLILGISWLIGVQFFTEQLKVQKKWIWLKLIVLGLLFAFFWHMPANGRELDNNPEFLIRFALFFLAGHLFVLFAPFVLKWNKLAYWNYLKSMGAAIGRSAFFSGVLFLGLVLALAAVDALFEVSIPGERYGQLFIFCLGIVNTWIYLSDFPSNVHANKTIEFHKALEVFVKYILIPLVLLYLAILYAYSFKILLEWELPKGWVSYLVTALALLGFVVQVIINPVQQTIKSWTINRFYPWFYWLLLPLIGLLFVAIARRVSDYGITENRYFVLLLAFWILGMSIYLLFTKRSRLIVLPISLFLLALLSSFGFWGAISVSKRSQVKQFKNVFEKARANSGLATNAQIEQLKSITKYLDDRDAASDLDDLTGINIEEVIRDTTDGKFYGYRSTDTDKLMDTLGIYLDPDDPDIDGLLYGQHYAYYGSNDKTYNFNISEFDYFTQINFSDFNTQNMGIGQYKVYYDPDEVTIYLKRNENAAKVITLPLKQKLLNLSKKGEDIGESSVQEMTLESENDSILIRMIFTDMGFNIRQDTISLSHCRAYLFLKQGK